MTDKPKRKPPTGGGRKGGTLYPKVDLEKAVKYAKKLVSKTHTGSQPKNIILPGVFDSATWLGEVRLSAVKQFGLLQGDPKGYGASELAKKINSSTPEELTSLLQSACLKPKIFKTAYDTFINDSVSDAKIKQQFLNHEVHPDSADECVQIFKASVVYAGLAQIADADKLQFGAISPAPDSDTNDESEVADQNNNSSNRKSKEDTDGKNGTPDSSLQFKKGSMNSSNVNVNIDIDPSMDPEKLEKLLKLLKNYGAI